ncbi:MAG: divalent metal cation transporter [Cytophagales bacterium]|nr:divalent metal cation transporter [Cytophagales bacterium]
MRKDVKIGLAIAGVLFAVLIVYVAVISAPPVKKALVHSFVPEKIDVLAIITLVGGTVGGYITFAGGHRLLDAGIKGKAALGQIAQSAVAGIGVASVIRVFLFLAALGVVSQGLPVDAGNPPASVFKQAAGAVGYVLFGLVMLAAAITSVIGSAYTSVSFIKSFSGKIERHENGVIIGFIVVSTLIFVTIGRPVQLLLLAGALNGLILPITLSTILVAAYREDVVKEYKHPWWLTVAGIVAILILAWMGAHTLITQLAL